MASYPNTLIDYIRTLHQTPKVSLEEEVKEEEEEEQPASLEETECLYLSVQSYFASRTLGPKNIQQLLAHIYHTFPADHSLLIVYIFFIEQVAFQHYYTKYRLSFQRFQSYTQQEGRLSSALAFRDIAKTPDFLEDVYQDLCIPPTNIHIYMEHLKQRFKSNVGLIVTDLPGNWAEFADTAFANPMVLGLFRDYVHYDTFVKDTYKFLKLCLCCYQFLCSKQLQDLYLSQEDRLDAFPFLQSKCNYADEFYPRHERM